MIRANSYTPTSKDAATLSKIVEALPLEKAPHADLANESYLSHITSVKNTAVGGVASSFERKGWRRTLSLPLGEPKKMNYGFFPEQEISGARYKNISTAKHTQIFITNPQGHRVGLPANRLSVENENIAIRCQYPLGEDEYIENHLRLFIENKIPILVILASKEDIRRDGLPAYFSTDQKYGAVEVQSIQREIDDNKTELAIDRYAMSLKYNNQTTVFPVLHVTNWVDQQSIRVEDLKELVELVNQIKDERISQGTNLGHWAIEDKNNPLPVIHCKAGVGRTGVLVAAMQYLKPENKSSMAGIISALRFSANDSMVQTIPQQQTLNELEALHPFYR